MIGTLVIVFREVLEAALVISIVLAATRGVAGRGWWVGGGVLAGLLGSAVVAGFAQAIADAAAGMGQEVFNGQRAASRRCRCWAGTTSGWGGTAGNWRCT